METWSQASQDFSKHVVEGVNDTEVVCIFVARLWKPRLSSSKKFGVAIR